MNQMETMEPLKKALMEALAKQKLQEDDSLARQVLGDEYEAFKKQTEEEVSESLPCMKGCEQVFVVLNFNRGLSQILEASVLALLE